MSSDVMSVDGTTALLVAETRRVIAAARTLPEAKQVALLGHLMATDIIVRASIAETKAERPIDAVVAISMLSQAVTADEPARLLVISGQWESFLRRAGLEAVHLVDPNVGEGDLAVAGSVTRRAVSLQSNTWGSCSAPQPLTRQAAGWLRPLGGMARLRPDTGDGGYWHFWRAS